MLDGIEFGGVRRKKHYPASKFLGSRRKPCLGMERSVIHYNHGILVQRRKELAGKPGLKQGRVHRSAILELGQNIFALFCSNNAAALILAAADAAEYLLVSWCVPILPIEIGIDATFVYIRDFIGRYILDVLQIGSYFLCILFLIAGCLFFRVIFSRFRASRIPLSLQRNSFAISL